MAYFDSWRIDFEAMKQESSRGPIETVFMDSNNPPVDISLRENQVPQAPIFEEE
ncbi:MAG: hypothetical protein UGF89_01930 [Acutalibacteraceae bacterium]|nr:hypothetical protein [Acutalibacteraceae bacterium]